MPALPAFLSAASAKRGHPLPVLATAQGSLALLLHAHEGIQTALLAVPPVDESGVAGGFSGLPVAVGPAGGVSEGGSKPLLGIFTKYADILDPETGEIVAAQATPAPEKSDTYDAAAVDLERWLLVAGARRLLMRVEDQDKRRRVPYTVSGDTVT